MEQTLDIKQLWTSVLDSLEKELSPATIKMWFKDSFITKINDGVVHVGCSNIFIKDWVRSRYHKNVFKALRDVSDLVRGVEYVVADKNKAPSKTGHATHTIQSNQLAIETPISGDDNLNPKYTFDSFVIGSFNELAYAASQAIIKQPGILYNPLFIYGNTGYGKTHLIQSTGNAIKHMYKDKKVFYITSERFTNEMTSGMQDGKIKQIKDRYRKYDVLIMDDIQFLSKKEKTQEELFHLFNVLYENNKQIIFSSDKHPNFIPELEDRLISRFNQGMIVDIQKPDHESRCEIIRKKAILSGLSLSDDIVSYIAEQVDGNVRELEGIVNSINCQSQLKKRTLSLNEIKDLLKNSTKPKQNVSVDQVMKIIAEFYNIEKENIINKSRRKEIVKPRQMVMYILREIYDISYPTIGDHLGGRDHTTVIHSYEKVKNDMKNDPVLAREIEQIKSML